MAVVGEVDVADALSQDRLGSSDYRLNESYEGSSDEDIRIQDERMRQIRKELGLIRLSWPNVEVEDSHLAQLPSTYRSTDDKEKLLLWYAENFRKQYRIVHPERKPLVLACDNECNVQKFVSISIRPTTLPYPELHKWQGCARFVSDHITYESPRRPLAMPERLCSPTWLLSTQTGNSFEIATLLVSFLLGRFYNAFVVSGYASREQTLCDTSMNPCPYLPESIEEAEKVDEGDSSKYHLKPPPDFRSKLLMDLEKQQQKRDQDEEDRLETDRHRKIVEQEQPRPDEFWGHRVHAWILILPDNEADGNRHPEVREPFFIEPSSGQNYAIDDEHTSLLYHGVESVWNHQNYWVNMQNCSEGCRNLKWDFWNTKIWEHLLPGEPWALRGIVEDKADEDLHILQEKHLDMPVSYVKKIEIQSLDFERRFPNGRKTMLFKKTKVQVYAPYIQMDGLIEKILVYSDYEYTSLSRVFEKYANRGDKLLKCTKYLDSGLVLDEYERGRADACKLHRYSSMGANSVDDERTLEFYDSVRIDGLRKIEMQPYSITQHYVERKDLLFYRKVEFAVDKGLIPAHDIHHRKILKITEEFGRNPQVPAMKDIAIREFNIGDEEIRLKYHYREEEVTRATRTFIKPPVAERGDRLVFDPSMTYGYNPDPLELPERPLDLFYLLEKQLREEELLLNDVRDAEKEVAGFLKARKQEYFMPKLVVSIFDGNRNEEAKAGLFAQEETARAMSQRQVEEEVDYLGPYLARIGNPKSLTLPQILQMRQECLSDFKQMLTDRANDIWRKYEACRWKLEELQNQLAQTEELAKEDEEKIVDLTNEVNFQMHTLDIRLKRHCDLSSHRYQIMVKTLDEDERLSLLHHD